MAKIISEELAKQNDSLKLGILMPALQNRFRVRISGYENLNFDSEFLVNQVISYDLTYEDDAQYLTVDIEIDAGLHALNEIFNMKRSSRNSIEIFSMNGNDEYYGMMILDGKIVSIKTGQDYAKCAVMSAKVKWKIISHLRKDGKPSFTVSSRPT